MRNEEELTGTLVSKFSISRHIPIKCERGISISRHISRHITIKCEREISDILVRNC